jgi:hypothetical protein
MAAFTGTVTMLRIHEGGYGPVGDRIEGEVVFQLHSAPGKTFGFTLRRDNQSFAHAAMVDLLRDALVDDHLQIRAEANIPDGKQNGIATRVTLQRRPIKPGAGGDGVHGGTNDPIG